MHHHAESLDLNDNEELYILLWQQVTIVSLDGSWMVLSPVEDLLTSALEIFEDDGKHGFLPPLGFHFFQFSKAHNSEIS